MDVQPNQPVEEKEPVKPAEDDVPDWGDSTWGDSTWGAGRDWGTVFSTLLSNETLNQEWSIHRSTLHLREVSPPATLGAR